MVPSAGTTKSPSAWLQCAQHVTASDGPPLWSRVPSQACCSCCVCPSELAESPSRSPALTIPISRHHGTVQPVPGTAGSQCRLIFTSALLVDKCDGEMHELLLFKGKCIRPGLRPRRARNAEDTLMVGARKLRRGCQVRTLYRTKLAAVEACDDRLQASQILAPVRCRRDGTLTARCGGQCVGAWMR